MNKGSSTKTKSKPSQAIITDTDTDTTDVNALLAGLYAIGIGAEDSNFLPATKTPKIITADDSGIKPPDDKPKY